jgi:hypothetical protein
VHTVAPEDLLKSKSLWLPTYKLRPSTSIRFDLQASSRTVDPVTLRLMASMMASLAMQRHALREERHPRVHDARLAKVGAVGATKAVGVLGLVREVLGPVVNARIPDA